MSTPPGQQIPPVIVDTPAQPSAGDYRVPNAGNTWGQEDESMASGRVAIVGCLGLALLMLGPICILLLFLLNLTH